MSVRVFNMELLDELVQKAKSNPRLRQHLNIHQDYSDPCQRLFNAIERGSYMRPHKHTHPPRDETMIAVRGQMALVIFDDTGVIIEISVFGVGGGLDLAYCVAVPSSYWHTVVAIEPGSILLEVKAGPFDPNVSKEFAPWAPEEVDSSSTDYLYRILAAVKDGIS